jgi:hypothetical protein
MATHVSLSALLAVTAFVSVLSLRGLLSMSTVVTLRQPVQAWHHDHKTFTRTNVRANSKNADNSGRLKEAVNKSANKSIEPSAASSAVLAVQSLFMCCTKPQAQNRTPDTRKNTKKKIDTRQPRRIK